MVLLSSSLLVQYGSEAQLCIIMKRSACFCLGYEEVLKVFMVLAAWRVEKKKVTSFVLKALVDWLGSQRQRIEFATTELTLRTSVRLKSIPR